MKTLASLKPKILWLPVLSSMSYAPQKAPKPCLLAMSFHIAVLMTDSLFLSCVLCKNCRLSLRHPWFYGLLLPAWAWWEMLGTLSISLRINTNKKPNGRMFHQGFWIGTTHLISWGRSSTVLTGGGGGGVLPRSLPPPPPPPPRLFTHCKAVLAPGPVPPAHSQLATCW